MAMLEHSLLTNSLRLLAQHNLAQHNWAERSEADCSPGVVRTMSTGRSRENSSQPSEQFGKIATFISAHPLRATSAQQLDRLLLQLARQVSSDASSSSDASDGNASVLIVTPDDLLSQTSTLPKSTPPNIGDIGSIPELVSCSSPIRQPQLSPEIVFESTSGATISLHRLALPLATTNFSYRQIVAFLASCQAYDWTFVFAGCWDPRALRPLVERSQQVLLIADSGKAQYGKIQSIGQELKGMGIDQQGLILLNDDHPGDAIAAA